MKHALFFILMILSCASFAQTQHAVVKTPMRRNINGQLTPAKYWDGATVEILTNGGVNGQTYVSEGGGKLSFPAKKPFCVSKVSANKGNFALLDAQFKNKRHSYSPTELDILVDDPEALAHAKAEGELIIGKRLRDSLRVKEDEIYRQRIERQISDEKYAEQIKQLKEEYNNIDSLTSKIVDAFLSTDYEKLDDFNKELFAFVQDGDFARVDSLLKTQKNSVEVFNEVKQKEYLARKIEDDARKEKEYAYQRFYTEYLYFIQRPLMQDSALHRLKMRADLDTTNISAVWEYAALCSKQNEFEDWEKYYQICLRFFQKNTAAYRADLAKTQNNLGSLYAHLHDYANSEKYYMLAFENIEQLFKSNPSAYRKDIADIQNNLGSLYLVLHDYANSEKFLKLALDKYEQLFKSNPNAYRADLASTQNNLGTLYFELFDNVNSEKFYKLALENFEQLFKENPDVYRADLAKTQNNLGNLYRFFRNYANSEKYYMLALENKEQLFKSNPSAYRKDIADIQNNLGSLYLVLHDYANSEKFLKLALDKYEQLFKATPNAYRTDLANVQNNLGSLYQTLQDYVNGEKFLKLALRNYEQMFRANPNTYREVLAIAQKDFGILHLALHDYANCEMYYKLALENYEQLFKENPNAYRAKLASMYGIMMLLYEEMNDEEKYDLALAKILELFKTKYTMQGSDFGGLAVESQNRTVLRMLEKGNVNEALALAKETLTMDESNVKSRILLAICYKYKAYAYAKDKKIKKALKSIDQAISLIPTSADFYDSKGEILLMQGKNQEALEMWEKVLELNPDFLKENPDGTELSNGLKKLGLIE